MKRRGAAAVTTLVLTCGAVASSLVCPVGAVAAVQPSAGTSSIGTLRITPPTGDDQVAPELFTSGPCPDPATNFIARIYGKGFTADGQVAVPNSPISSADPDPEGKGFGAPTVMNLRDLAATQKKQFILDGTYTFVLTCITPLGRTDYGDFTGALRIHDGHYTTAGVEPTPVPSHTQPPGAGAGPVAGPPSAHGSGPAASGATGVPAATTAPSSGAAGAPFPTPSTPPEIRSQLASASHGVVNGQGLPVARQITSSSGTPRWVTVFIVLVALWIAGGLIYLLRQRRRSADGPPPEGTG